jgi:hypothetical protein
MQAEREQAALEVSAFGRVGGKVPFGGGGGSFAGGKGSRR